VKPERPTVAAGLLPQFVSGWSLPARGLTWPPSSLPNLAMGAPGGASSPALCRRLGLAGGGGIVGSGNPCTVVVGVVRPCLFGAGD
jgi:hypothetical protein